MPIICRQLWRPTKLTLKFTTLKFISQLKKYLFLCFSQICAIKLWLAKIKQMIIFLRKGKRIFFFFKTMKYDSVEPPEYWNKTICVNVRASIAEIVWFNQLQTWEQYYTIVELRQIEFDSMKINRIYEFCGHLRSAINPPSYLTNALIEMWQNRAAIGWNNITEKGRKLTKL